MAPRVDQSSRLILATATDIYGAFANPEMLQRWLPPEGMEGEILEFDFRSGGKYRMRLIYSHPANSKGKTTADADDVTVRLLRIEPNRQIVKAVDFDSEDPAFQGTMTMIWAIEPGATGTLVSVRATGVPEGISPEDHELGLNSSLANLASLLERS